MKRSKLILYHAIAWLLFYAYNIIGIYLEEIPNKGVMMLIQVAFVTSMMVTFYYCFILAYTPFFKETRWPQLSRIIQIVIVLAIAPFVFTTSRYMIEEVLYPLLFGFRNYTEGTTFFYYIGDNWFRATPMMVFSAAVWGIQESFEKEKENKMLREEKIQAELAFLKTQINPHFLYNTLNYIYSLAYPVSDKLGNAVIKLSELMRYMLYESKDGKVELQKEVDYLHNYLDIYRLRFEDKFFVNFDIHGHLNGQRVATLVLIPFVENALKHGVADDPEAPIQINLQLQNQDLHFEVSNLINQHQKDQTTGIGLANIRRRLELIYPGKYNLDIQDNGQQFKTVLKLKGI
ncbi:sensor histidine kinase YesM [Pontibacter aydingkolensis]|uniref:Histidine kinase n=1 Tax=Pontibacter aydingkolensis TaxID=1911536 RepID=A0ABS7CTW8_9BACT|nr:histidine kinase [Pontibacter aydingkolensis]MBW7467298.1 histidine kinase [Pontibacter aydingkolensis]